jgi:hypothetical protein
MHSHGTIKFQQAAAIVAQIHPKLFIPREKETADTLSQGDNKFEQAAV